MSGSGLAFTPRFYCDSNDTNYLPQSDEFVGAKGGSVYTGYTATTANMSSSALSFTPGNGYNQWFTNGKVCTVGSTLTETFDLATTNLTSSKSCNFGDGGSRGEICYFVCAQGAPSAVSGLTSGSGRGAEGESGLVILKWYE